MAALKILFPALMGAPDACDKMPCSACWQREYVEGE